MNVPLIGFIGDCKKPAARYVIRGNSRKTGFFIRFKYPHLNFKESTYSKEFHTSLYDPDNMHTLQEEKWGEICFLGSLIIGIFGAILVHSIIWCIPIIFCAILIGLGLSFQGIKDVPEWHALEHKTWTLFSESIEPTIENLKKIPSISIFCVTNFLISVIIFISSFWILRMLPVESPLWQFNTSSIVVISSLTFLGLLLITPQSPLLYLLITPFVAPVAIPTLLFQRIMFLKEPSDEKYESVLKDIKQYMGIDSQINYAVTLQSAK